MSFPKLSLLLLLLTACTNQTPGTAEKTPVVSDSQPGQQKAFTEDNPKQRFKNIAQVLKDTQGTRWKATPDGSSEPGLIEVVFQGDTALYFYHGQCMFYYPLRLEADQIVMYWDDNMDCTFDAGLHDSFGLEQVPEVGKPFARYELLNDSTLKATYLYPQWVHKYNEKIGAAELTVFPAYLYANQ